MRSAFQLPLVVSLVLLACSVAPVGAQGQPEAVAAIDVVVSLRVSTPTLAVTPTSFSLQLEVGDPLTTAALTVWNATADGTRMNYLLSASPGWLSCGPTTGVSTGDLQSHTLSIDPSGLAAGDHTGEVTITAPGAENSPLVVPVNLRIDPVVPPDMPNLAIEAFDFSPQDVSPDGGTSITFAGRITNDGAASTTDTFRVEFSVWPELPGQPSQIFLTEVWEATELLAPGESIDLSTIVLPTNPLAPGVYYVGIVVDSSDAIAERNETDNTAWVTVKKLYVGPRPAAVKTWRRYM